MNQPQWDLLLAGGHVIDPSQDWDGAADIAFANGKVAAFGPSLDRSAAKRVEDARGLVVTPGLIDLHTHVHWPGTSYGVSADMLAPRCGMTTAVDAGSAGAGTIEGFKINVMDRSRVRILAYLNLSFPGIFALDRRVQVGEAHDLRLLNIDACIEAAQRFAQVVVGLKIRVGASTTGALGTMPLDMTIEAAEALGLPVMAHVGGQPPPLIDEIAGRLRPGDILTHCYKPFPNAPVSPKGSVREAVLDARRRGVIFDLGHGAGSFGFDTARRMLDAGFEPDVVSSDVHALCVDGPAHDVLHVASKMVALGMPLANVVRAMTLNPASAIRRADLGTLAPGSAGDASILGWSEEPVTFRDSTGASLSGTKVLRCDAMVLGGAYASREQLAQGAGGQAR